MNGVVHPSIRCSNCGRLYPDAEIPYCCPVCGGVYALSLPAVNPQVFDRSQPGIWRYREIFGLPPATHTITLGEGQTPLVWGNAFGRPVAFKLEYLNPTGSFKDRGSAVLASFLLSRGALEALEDSSGNAGASFAAYAARAGIRARIYIPAYAAGSKRKQIEAYGAQVVAVPGSRADTSEAVRQAAASGVVYASHAYLPQTLLGYATLAYELFEQLSAAPGTVIIPAGQGNLLLATGLGFAALKEAGIIDREPSLVGVQARACAPLWAVDQYGPTGLGWVTEGETLAEGVRIKHPLRGDAILQMVRRTGGTFVAVDEDEILPGRDDLARQGFYVEPTSAIVWSALRQVTGSLPEPFVAVLTGSGFKFQE